MALPPPPAPSAAPPPPGGPAAAPPPPGGDADASDDNVVCTIVNNGDGSYTVYAGDEPDDDTSGMSEDDAGAMGAAGEEPASQGQQAPSKGATLKIVNDILTADSSGGSGPNNADAQFAAGFSGAPAGGAPGP